MSTYLPMRNEGLFNLHQDIPTDPPSVVKTITFLASVFTELKNLNASKAPRPDGIPNWILKTYGEILASPISNLLNTFYEEENFLLPGKELTSFLSQKKNLRMKSILILDQFHLPQRDLSWPRIS